ncbi:MAG TPA: tripartite tricarboxylate transporter TctB family protein [Burkholderiales bacterium]|nr:tripartite tricarboxylate transporter TctB family protein [Burkholderiales bacterium]
MPHQASQDAASRFVLTMPMKASLLATTGLILMGLVALYVDTYNMVPPSLPGYPGDAFFPRAVLIFSGIWAAIILLRGLFLSQAAATRHEEAPYFTVHWPEFVSVIVLVLVYAELLEPVGFEITTIVFMMVLLIPRLMAGPGVKPARAMLQALGLSMAAMLILYAGLGPALKIGLPLRFLPTYIL